MLNFLHCNNQNTARCKAINSLIALYYCIIKLLLAVLHCTFRIYYNNISTINLSLSRANWQ